MIEALDELVRQEIFASRSEAIRVAARDLLQRIVFGFEETIEVGEEKPNMLEEEMKLKFLNSPTVQ